jgi:nucleotide-binding universal stress UspA family protein
MTINARKELLKLKELAESTNANSNHDFEVILSTDELTDAIEFAVKKHKINMVVMGTKGSTAAKELFFGSNTVKVIQRMRLCPVLIVPTDIDFIVPKQIAFPTDFSRYYGNKELDPLKNISALYNSKIRIVHINVETHFDEVQEYNLKMLKEYLKNCEHSFHWIPDYSKRVVEIKDFIDAYGINMLVMVNYKHSFIESIVNEPVIKKIGFGPTVPFLVIPD